MFMARTTAYSALQAQPHGVPGSSVHQRHYSRPGFRGAPSMRFSRGRLLGAVRVPTTSMLDPKDAGDYKSTFLNQNKQKLTDCQHKNRQSYYVRRHEFQL
jgi:hypothetical protein